MRNPTVYKIIASVIVIMLLVFIAIHFIYSAVFKQRWMEEAAAIARALAETELVSSMRVEAFSYEESYMIVFGHDQDNREMIVWVGEEELHAAYADQGVHKNLLRVRLLEQDPQAEILRSTPGKYNGEWVWEVHYRSGDEAGKRTYYAYYRFSDGELLQRLAMSR